MGSLSLGIAERRQCLFHSLKLRLKLISFLINHNENGLSRQNPEEGGGMYFGPFIGRRGRGWGLCH